MTAVVIVCAYNCADMLTACLTSVAEQDYPDLRVVVVDDASTDGTAGVAAAFGQRNGWAALLNRERVGATANIWAALHQAAPDDEDVVILVDGDDRLPHAGCVSSIMAVYDDPNVWMTYGGYQADPPDVNCPVTAPYPDEVVRARSFRSWSNLFNHPITAKGFLWRHLDETDLRLASGEWVPMVYDEAYGYPLLEYAGPHTRCLDDVLYTYNSANPASCNADEDRRQIMIAAGDELRGRPKKPRLYRDVGGFVSSSDSGELLALKSMVNSLLSWVVDTTGRLDTKALTWDERADRVMTIQPDLRRYIQQLPVTVGDARVMAVYGDPLEIVRLVGPTVPPAVWWSTVNGATLDLVYLVMSRGSADVILIDDAWRLDTPGYPTAEELAAQVGNMAAAVGVPYRVETAYEVVRITPEEN